MKNKYSLYLFLTLFIFICIAPTSNTFASGDEPEINALSGILIDASTGQILYKKNENSKRYPASITKLMTALLAIEALEPDQTLIFSQNAVLSIEFGSSHIGIREGEILTFDQAIHGLLLMSANEVANGIAEKVNGSVEGFSELMNLRAQELGAKNSNFINPHGLHDKNHYTTAYDMALIAKEIVTKPYFLSIMKDITYDIPETNKVDEIRYLYQQHKMINPKRDPSIFREDVIGGKTGFTNEAGQTLVTIAKQDDRILIAVALKGEANSIYEDTNKLFDYGFAHFKRVNLEPTLSKQTVQILDKKDGSTIGEAILQIKDPIKIQISKNTSVNNLIFKPTTPKLYSDVLQGSTVGTVSIYDGDSFIAEADLTIMEIDLPESLIIPTDEGGFNLFRIILGIIGLGLIFLFYQKVFLNKRHYSKYVKKQKNRSISSQK